MPSGSARIENKKGGDELEREKSCCFSGHRPNKLPWGWDEGDLRCVALKERIWDEVRRAYDDGCRHFICGMAQGSDFYFCEAVLMLRDERPGVTVEAAIPCEEQADRWPQEDRERYERLIGLCDFETMVQRHYDRSCMLRRNRYMVDHAARLIAVYDGSRGGTRYTIRYAQGKGTKVVVLELGTGVEL